MDLRTHSNCTISKSWFRCGQHLRAHYQNNVIPLNSHACYILCSPSLDPLCIHGQYLYASGAIFALDALRLYSSSNRLGESQNDLKSRVGQRYQQFYLHWTIGSAVLLAFLCKGTLVDRPTTD